MGPDRHGSGPNLPTIYCWPFNGSGRVEKVREGGDSPDAVRCDSKLIVIWEISRGPRASDRRAVGVFRAVRHRDGSVAWSTTTRVSKRPPRDPPLFDKSIGCRADRHVDPTPNNMLVHLEPPAARVRPRPRRNAPGHPQVAPVLQIWQKKESLCAIKRNEACHTPSLHWVISPGI